MKKASLLLLFLTLLSCASPRPSQQTPWPVRDREGNLRGYKLYLPPGEYRGLPLLVYFHGVVSEGFSRIPTLRGYTGSPVEETGLIEFCRRRRIALLAPEPLYAYSFLGVSAKGWLISKERDGVERIIDRVIEKAGLDGGEVYLAGISAGAAFCHHLAQGRPGRYKAILSHSQAYVDEGSRLLTPPRREKPDGVLFAYCDGDYPELIDFVVRSEALYRGSGYKTVVLKNLLPSGHRWSSPNNERFWRLLRRLGNPN